MKCRRRCGAVLVSCVAAVWFEAAHAGTLVGRVALDPPPARQVMQRYPQGDVSRSDVVEVIPTIVYIKGQLPSADLGELPERYEIVQKGTRFRPSHLVIPVGGTVDFPNQDTELHNVFSYSKARRFDLGRYPAGESKSVDFSRPGIVKIYCEIHPWMRAAVLVVENPHFAVLDDEGSFVIDDLPAGEYTLVAWNIDRGAVEQRVVVPAEGRVETELRLAEGEASPMLDEQRVVVRVRARPADEGASDGGAGCCATGGGADPPL